MKFFFTSPCCFLIISFINNDSKDFNPLVPSVLNIGRLTKISIMEGILKKIPMAVALMSR